MTHQLPPGFCVRPPTLDDAQAVTDLLNTCAVADIGSGDASLALTLRGFNEPGRNLATDNWLVLAPDGGVVAYAEYSEYEPYDWDEIGGYVHPDYVGRGIGKYLMHVLEERARQALPKAPPSGRVIVETSAWRQNERAQRLFRRFGFQMQRVWNRMQIDMDAPPPAPSWPDGIALRTFSPASTSVRPTPRGRRRRATSSVTRP